MSGSEALRNAGFDEGISTVLLEGLECDGSENSLLFCPMDVELGLSLCSHSDVVGIRCYGMYRRTIFCIAVFFADIISRFIYRDREKYF